LKAKSNFKGRAYYFLHLHLMTDKLLINWEKKSAERQKLYKNFLQRASKNDVLRKLPDLNEEAFNKIDCLQCANCCKNYSPRFKTPDIKRISKHLKMKEGDFIETYLRVDEDGDYVAKSKPCPFLGSDNYCSIYDVRPSDCERFPYTDEDVIIKRQPLTLKNSTFCPIVYYVLEKLINPEIQ
jgi:Fe-S-cluster containining protein